MSVMASVSHSAGNRPLSPAITVAPAALLEGVAGRGDARTEFTEIIHETHHEIPVQYPAANFLRVGVRYAPPVIRFWTGTDCLLPKRPFVLFFGGDVNGFLPVSIDQHFLYTLALRFYSAIR